MLQPAYARALIVVLLLLAAAGVLASSTAAGVVAVISAGVLAFLQPKTGLMVLACYVPAREWLVAYSPGLKALTDVVVAAALVRVIFDKWRAGRPRELFNLNAFEWAYLGFIGLGAVVAFVSSVPLSAILFEIRAFLLMYLVFYIVRRFERITEGDLRLFLWVCFWTAMVVCAQGLMEKLSYRTLGVPEAWKNWNLSATNRNRIYGMPGNPNVLAYYLGLCYLFTISLLAQYAGLRSRVAVWTRRGLFLGLIAMAGVFVLTFSRGSAISYFVVFITCWLWYRPRRALLSALLPFFLGIVLVAYPVHLAASHMGEYEKTKMKQAQGPQRFTSAFDRNQVAQSMDSGRLFIIKKGMEVFRDHPLVGTGFGSFGDSAAHAYGSPLYPRYHLPASMYADNQYIQILVETGAAGVLLFAVYLLGFMVKILEIKKSGARSAVMLLGLLFGACFAGLYYNIWEDKVFTFFFFLAAGAIRRAREEAKP